MPPFKLINAPKMILSFIINVALVSSFSLDPVPINVTVDFVPERDTDFIVTRDNNNKVIYPEIRTINLEQSESIQLEERIKEHKRNLVYCRVEEDKTCSLDEVYTVLERICNGRYYNISLAEIYTDLCCKNNCHASYFDRSCVFPRCPVYFDR